MSFKRFAIGCIFFQNITQLVTIPLKILFFLLDNDNHKWMKLWNYCLWWASVVVLSMAFIQKNLWKKLPNVSLTQCEHLNTLFLFHWVSLFSFPTNNWDYPTCHFSLFFYCAIIFFFNFQQHSKVNST